jgi:hydroxyethylthiazole kinase-like uncharacterized protein yjeF
MKSQKWTARDAKKCIVIPSDLDHKYSRGTLGMITGSAKYPGAAVLTSRAAVATGLGVLRFHSSSGLAHLVLHSIPEALVQPGKVDAWLCGSGVSEKKYDDVSTWLRHRWFALIKAQSVPTILDAGALNWAGKLSQPTLITPHSGELSKLLKKRGISASTEAIESDPAKWAEKASQILGSVVLLKGATTYVASEKNLIELPKATAWLATAGTGDVLAGIIGALVATNYIAILNDPEQLAKVAATGAFIHNLAAIAASKDAPISATSIIEFIPEVIRKIIK